MEELERALIESLAQKEHNESLDPVDSKEVKKKFKDRKDKDIDNDGDVDSSDKYLHKRRKAISMAAMGEEVALSEESKTIEKVKEIVNKKQAMKIDGVMVDMFTASAIAQIYDKVNDANKKKMDGLKITKLADLAMKMMQREEVEDVAEATRKRPAARLTKTKPMDKGKIAKLSKIVRDWITSEDEKPSVLNKLEKNFYDELFKMRPDLKGNLNRTSFTALGVDSIKTITGVNKWVNDLIKDNEGLNEGFRDPKMKDAIKQGVKRGNVVKGTSKFSAKEVKMATGIAKQKGGNMTDAVERIEKIAKGLSDHPSVARALKMYNEAKELRHSEWGHGEIMERNEDGTMTVLFVHGVEENVTPENVHFVEGNCKSMKKEEEDGCDNDDYSSDIKVKDRKDRKRALVGSKEEKEVKEEEEVVAEDYKTVAEVEEEIEDTYSKIRQSYLNAIKNIWENTAKQKSIRDGAPKDDVDVERKSGNEMRFKNMHRDNVDVDDTDEKGHDDVAKAARATTRSSARGPGDKTNSGDQKPVK